MPVTGRGLCADATDAVPPEGGCVEKVHIIVECTLQNRTLSRQKDEVTMFPWCLLEKYALDGRSFAAKIRMSPLGQKEQCPSIPGHPDTFAVHEL
jgi:hypothetical protein